MNTNLIILNALRKAQKYGGGYIILDATISEKSSFRVSDIGANSNIDYNIHNGENYLYVPAKNITYPSIDLGILDNNYINSITFINFDLIDNLNNTNPNPLIHPIIFNFINCKKITTNTSYVIEPPSRAICNTNALINLYRDHCEKGFGPQYTTDAFLESCNCIIPDTISTILLCNTKYTDIYIGDCITKLKIIGYSYYNYDPSNGNIRRIHINKFDKDNIKLGIYPALCDRIIIIDDSTLKKYKPIYNADKMQFAEIVNGTYSIPSLLKLTFTANADTTVKVYFTKESFGADTPDNTISLYANQEVVTSYARESIYKFKIEQPNVITSAKIEGLVLYCALLFNNCSNLTTLDISKLNTSKVTNMSEMFCGCSNLTTLDISHFNTSNVTNMSQMFSTCKGLTSLNVSNFDTSKATSMNGMFTYCSSLTALEISNWDTSKVTDMNSMFENCSKLSTIGQVDTASGWQHTPTNYASMFFNCPATPKPKWYK